MKRQDVDVLSRGVLPPGTDDVGFGSSSDRCSKFSSRTSTDGAGGGEVSHTEYSDKSQVSESGGHREMSDQWER